MAFDLIAYMSDVTPSKKQINCLKGRRQLFNTDNEDSDNDANESMQLEIQINRGYKKIIQL